MKYYCIKQHDITDCGAACLATICKQNGYKIGITQIREVAVKGDETKGLFSRFFHLLLPQKKLLLHIFVASLVYTILGIVGAFYFKQLIDSILPDGLREQI